MTAATITKALRWLLQKQLPSGGFLIRRYSDPGLSAPGPEEVSTFVSATIVHAVSVIPQTAESSAIIRAGLEHLLASREPDGTWRYDLARRTANDPDLDDTCCAAFVLRRLAPNDFASQDGPVLANRTAGGLFKTWLRAPDRENVVDSVINANVLLYLGDRPETERAAHAICETIREGRERSINARRGNDTAWYYTTPLALYYSIARACAFGAASLQPCRAPILERMIAMRAEDGSFCEGDAFSTALALAAARYLRSEDDWSSTLRWLAARQSADGSWPRGCWYAGPDPPKDHEAWWGAEEITTAMAIEAMAMELP